MNDQVKPLEPGSTWALANYGWPHATIVRETDGQYFMERMSHDLRKVRRTPLSEKDALASIESDLEIEEEKYR